MSILTLREKILIFLKNCDLTFEDILEALLDPYSFWREASLDSSRGYSDLRKALRKELLFLQKHGYINDIVTGKKVYLKPSLKGEDRINWSLSIEKKKGKWIGKWFIVVFDIPEKYRGARDNLRIKLRELGFGMLQNSVFINPYNYFKELKSLAERNQIRPYLRFIVADKIDDPGYLIQTSWDFQGLNIKYEKFMAKCCNLKFRGLNFVKRIIMFKELEKELMHIGRHDPRLPNKLCPQGYLGHKAQEYLKRIEKRLFKERKK
ncbi:MAG: CRISPR-associated endonuclease Cas2 [Candidatus Omnitrophica bacterium]|nr:CRISPR-associated endonuclease Cas2 [Candidatus Omnitrophota bacterium]